MPITTTRLFLVIMLLGVVLSVGMSAYFFQASRSLLAAAMSADEAIQRQLEYAQSGEDTRNALRGRVAELESELRLSRAELIELQRQLEAAGMRAEPDPQSLFNAALQELESAVVEVPAAAADSAQISHVNISALENRVMNRDLDARMAAVEAEADYGAFLDELGIGEPRRDSILAAIAQASLRRAMDSALLAEGQISDEEARRRFEENSVSTVLDALLTEDERPALAQLDQRVAINESETMLVQQLRMSNRGLPASTIHVVADLYMERLVPSLEERQVSASELMRMQMEMAPQVREELRGLLDEEEFSEIDRFIDSQVVLYEQLMRFEQ